MNRITPAALALLLAAATLLAGCDRKGASNTPDNPARAPMPSASAASQ